MWVLVNHQLHAGAAPAGGRLRSDLIRFPKGEGTGHDPSSVYFREESLDYFSPVLHPKKGRPDDRPLTISRSYRYRLLTSPQLASWVSTAPMWIMATPVRSIPLDVPGVG